MIELRRALRRWLDMASLYRAMGDGEGLALAHREALALENAINMRRVTWTRR